MGRITNKDFEIVTAALTNNAQFCGMLALDENILVNRGNSEYATVVTIIRRSPWAERSASWLPRFTPKDTPRTQYKALAAAADALRGAADVIEALRANAEGATAN